MSIWKGSTERHPKVSAFRPRTWFVGSGEAPPALAQAYPAFFSPHTDTRSFLMTLNEIIHPEVRKLYPGADDPKFTFEELPDGKLRMGYDSHRKLCSFAEGLIDGAAGRFREQVMISLEVGVPQEEIAVKVTGLRETDKRFSLQSFGEGVYRVVVPAAGVSDRAEPPTLEDFKQQLRTIAGTDFGVHSPRWLSRFGDATHG